MISIFITCRIFYKYITTLIKWQRKEIDEYGKSRILNARFEKLPK